jgi:hypothetical protein
MDGFSRFVTIANRSATTSATVVTLVVAGLGILSCQKASTSPSPTSALVTFRVVNETFKVLLTESATIDLARRAQAGSVKRFPNGRIVAGTDVNTGWNWHLVDVEMVEASIELCDGRPSDVEHAGASYGGGRFCPWSATVVSIEDR